MYGFAPTTGLAHAPSHHRMTGKFPDVTDHIQEVLKEGCHHHHVELLVAPHQGGMTGDRHLSGGAVRHGVHQGGAQRDKGP